MLTPTPTNKPPTRAHHHPQPSTTTQKNCTITDSHPLPPSNHPQRCTPSVVCRWLWVVTRCNKAHFRMCFKASKLKESKRTKNKKKKKKLQKLMWKRKRNVSNRIYHLEVTFKGPEYTRNIVFSLIFWHFFKETEWLLFSD